MKTLDTGEIKFTSNIFKYYRSGCSVEVEMRGNYHGEEVVGDLRGDEISQVIDFLQEHQKDVEETEE